MVTPMSPSSSMSLLTSLISGMLLIVIFSDVNNTAEITCNASFFAPWGIISPLSGLPPFITNALFMMVRFVERQLVLFSSPVVTVAVILIVIAWIIVIATAIVLIIVIATAIVLITIFAWRSAVFNAVKIDVFLKL